jgi:hypothetical protein
MKKLLAICTILCSLSFLATFAVADDMAMKDTTVNGWVTDSGCGVKGTNAEHAACTKKCLDKGAKLVVVTDTDKKVLTVDNPDALKGHEGHHMSVTGTITGDSIHVSGMKML